MCQHVAFAPAASPFYGARGARQAKDSVLVNIQLVSRRAIVSIHCLIAPLHVRLGLTLNESFPQLFRPLA